MYWYNPKTQTSERVAAPCDDEQAIRMLAGHTDSATFVSEYADLRYSGMQIETALTTVGHEFRLRQHEFLPVSQAGHHRLKKPLGRVLAGTNSCWQCVLGKKVGAEGWSSASREGHDPQHRIGTSENTPSRSFGE